MQMHASPTSQVNMSDKSGDISKCSSSVKWARNQCSLNGGGEGRGRTKGWWKAGMGRSGDRLAPEYGISLLFPKIAEAMEIMLIAVVSPVIRCEWQLENWQVALVTTVSACFLSCKWANWRPGLPCPFPTRQGERKKGATPLVCRLSKGMGLQLQLAFEAFLPVFPP